MSTTKSEKLERLFNTRSWASDIKIEKKTNTGIFPSGIDDFGEAVANVIADADGVGSKGSGWDGVIETNSENIPTKSIETKTCCKAQRKTCIPCTEKSESGPVNTVFSKDKCIYCGNETEFDYPEDSRWPLSAEKYMKYRSILQWYVFNLLEVEKSNESMWTGTWTAWKINTNDQYFEKCMERQMYEMSADTLNFMPLSEDFYNCERYRVFEASLEFDLESEETSASVEFLDFENGIKELHPVDSTMQKSQLEELSEMHPNLSRISKNSHKKDEMIDLICEQGVTEFDVQKYPYENKKRISKKANKNGRRGSN